MTEQLKDNHKDQRMKLDLRKMIERRRRMLKCLKKQNARTYYHVLRDLNLRDMVFV